MVKETKQRIVFIGAGNLATHLSMTLQQAGYDVAQVYSRTEDSAQRLAVRHDYPHRGIVQ